MSRDAALSAAQGPPRIEGLDDLWRRTSAVLAPVLLCLATWTAPTFFRTYAWFAALSVVIVGLSLPHVRPLLLFAAGALLFGLINISHWRGYIEPMTVRLYALTLLALHLPFALLPRDTALMRGRLRLGTFPSAIVLLHGLAAFGAVAVVYLTLGPVIIRQALRFDIPVSLEYAVKSTLPLCVLVPMVVRRGSAQAIAVVLCVLPALLIGSRGSALIALLSFLLARAFCAPGEATRHAGRTLRLVLFGAVSLVVVIGGFFLRRSGDSQLAAASIVADAYFDYHGWWVYPVMPFHLGFREPAGLTNQIVAEGLRNDVNPTPLFWADLVTVLPGSQQAAGQSLGEIIGTVDAGGLTPGLLGGLYLDFGVGAIAVVALLSTTLALVALAGSRAVRYAPLFLLAEMQLLHLFHRGFIKPEYITSLAILVFYLWIAEEAPTGDAIGPSPARLL